MKLLPIILLFTCIFCNSADNPPKDSPYRLNVPSSVDSPRRRSKNLVERILGDQMLPERESSPRSKEILKIWNSKNNDPVPGVSVTLCKVVRSKSVPQVDVEPPKDSSSLIYDQNAAPIAS